MKYVFSAYLNMPEKFGYGARVGAYFSENQILFPDSSNLMWLTPQIVIPSSIIDKQNWVLWQDTLTSEDGDEEYITIGNFFADINSDTVYSGSGESSYNGKGYYYIDDISVTPIDTTTGIPETEKPKLKIFPNPAGNQITIEQSGVTGNQLSVEVYDALGRLVTLSIVEGQQTTIPLNLSKGVYLLRVKEKEEVVFWEKLIIE